MDLRPEHPAQQHHLSSPKQNISKYYSIETTLGLLYRDSNNEQGDATEVLRQHAPFSASGGLSKATKVWQRALAEMRSSQSLSWRKSVLRHLLLPHY